MQQVDKDKISNTAKWDKISNIFTRTGKTSNGLPGHVTFFMVAEQVGCSNQLKAMCVRKNKIITETVILPLICSYFDNFYNFL